MKPINTSTAQTFAYIDIAIDIMDELNDEMKDKLGNGEFDRKQFTEEYYRRLAKAYTHVYGEDAINLPKDHAMKITNHIVSLAFGEITDLEIPIEYITGQTSDMMHYEIVGRLTRVITKNPYIIRVLNKMLGDRIQPITRMWVYRIRKKENIQFYQPQLSMEQYTDNIVYLDQVTDHTLIKDITTYNRFQNIVGYVAAHSMEPTNDHRQTYETMKHMMDVTDLIYAIDHRSEIYTFIQPMVKVDTSDDYHISIDYREVKNTLFYLGCGDLNISNDTIDTVVEEIMVTMAPDTYKSDFLMTNEVNRLLTGLLLTYPQYCSDDESFKEYTKELLNDEASDYGRSIIITGKLIAMLAFTTFLESIDDHHLESQYIRKGKKINYDRIDIIKEIILDVIDEHMKLERPTYRVNELKKSIDAVISQCVV